MVTDFRSDTLTQATPAMMEAMIQAPTGDDVYEEDPTVNALQEKAATLFGMEAALFCPSGTMTNQIAVKILTQAGDEVICYKGAHIYKYEGGGLMFNSGVSPKLVDAPQGKLLPEGITDNLNAEDIHYPPTRLVAIENTVNRAGGTVYTLEEIKVLSETCHRHGLAFHLDGARVFNALTASGDRAQDYGQYFDTISVCLSKGLGCPVGSLLLASKELIKKAKRVRKVFGGGMRQAGFLAGAGIYALDKHVERLPEDHRKARLLADALAKKSFLKEVIAPQTNIVIFYTHNTEEAQKIIRYFAQNEVLIGTMDKTALRMVTHLDINEQMLEKTLRLIEKIGS